MNDQELTLTVRQSQRYQVLQAAVDGLRTNQQAARALGLSLRQVQRLKGKIRRVPCPLRRHACSEGPQDISSTYGNFRG